MAQAKWGASQAGLTSRLTPQESLDPEDLSRVHDVVWGRSALLIARIRLPPFAVLGGYRRRNHAGDGPALRDPGADFGCGVLEPTHDGKPQISRDYPVRRTPRSGHRHRQAAGVVPVGAEGFRTFLGVLPVLWMLVSAERIFPPDPNPSTNTRTYEYQVH